MTTYDKDAVEVSLNLKTSRYDIMPTLFYSNISEFDGNLQVVLDEGRYKTSIQFTDNTILDKIEPYFDVLCSFT